jgi:hypothetical protein
VIDGAFSVETPDPPFQNINRIRCNNASFAPLANWSRVKESNLRLQQTKLMLCR